ncbi:MAG: hypothetical protein JO057_11300 [Chloroflexi bacterium]|nr:hypothetical protein [Chloroflexota bacterium]
MPDPRDRRAILVEPDLARIGSEARHFYGGMSQAMQRVYARFSDAELATVLAFLHAMEEERLAR